MAEKLRNCPFCGSSNVDPEGWSSHDTKFPACDDCGASVGLPNKSPQENIAAWNTRAVDPLLDRIYCNCPEPYFGAREEGSPVICERCMKEVEDIGPSLRQQLAEAEARVRVLDNTLDVERDAFRNMQMQKEALEARNKRLATPVSDEQTVWYHGTRPENVDSIKTYGFREGTWFARHMEDAAGYGGSHVFSVRVSFSVDPERWQVCCSNAIPACAIERLSIVTALADERKETEVQGE